MSLVEMLIKRTEDIIRAIKSGNLPSIDIHVYIRMAEKNIRRARFFTREQPTKENLQELNNLEQELSKIKSWAEV